MPNLKNDLRAAQQNAAIREGKLVLNPVPLYNAKEPFMPSVDSSFGYQGVVLIDLKTQRIQCHICGEWFLALSSHLSRIHKTNAKAYKTKYGLKQTASLVGEATRLGMVKRQIEQVEKDPEKFRANIAKASEKIKHRHYKRASIQRDNEKGACPLQMLEGVRALATKLKRTPTIAEMREAGIHREKLVFTFGSVIDAVRMAGLIPRSKADPKGYGIEPTRLLEMITLFYKRHNRWPRPSDFHRSPLLPSLSTLRRYWGSIENVRRLVGWPTYHPGNPITRPNRWSRAKRP